MTNQTSRTDRRTAPSNTSQDCASSDQIRERTGCLIQQPTSAPDVTNTESILRVSRFRLSQLQSNLAVRDMELLILLRDHRFLTSRHVTTLIHTNAATILAGFRAAQRQLRKLCEWRLVNHLPRRIGGWQSGQAQTVWYLTEVGHRLLALQITGGDTAQTESSLRHRFREPSQQFLAHILRIADIRVVLEQVSRTSDSKRATLVQTEPTCWRDWTGAYGVSRTLKPDLYTELTDQEYDYFYFIEADMGTEHTPVIVRKAAVYQAYKNSGYEQAQHGGIFPLVLWVTPDQRRADAILATIRADPTLETHLHQTVSISDLSRYICGRDPP